MFFGNINTFSQGSNEELINYELSHNNYIISLPENYKISINDPRMDFIVYYFNFYEETHGGIYFGNHPSSINTTGEKITTIKSMLLGILRNWDIYHRNNKYYTEIIIDNIGGNAWEQKMNIWIIGTTINDIENMLFYYTTIRRENN